MGCASSRCILGLIKAYLATYHNVQAIKEAADKVKEEDEGATEKSDEKSENTENTEKPITPVTPRRAT